jgi:Transmembrane protein 231
MWKKEHFYFEQPDVRFRNELTLEVVTEDSLRGLETLMFSTVRSVNQFSMNELGVPLIKQTAVDRNKDGLLDQLNLHIELKSLPGRGSLITKSVRQVRIIGTVDYSLKDMLQLEMIGLF